MTPEMHAAENRRKEHLAYGNAVIERIGQSRRNSSPTSEAHNLLVNHWAEQDTDEAIRAIMIGSHVGRVGL